jgi:signal transduction histidine kinase
MKTPVSIIDLVIQKHNSGDIDTDSAIENISEENERLLTTLEQVINLIRVEDFAKDYVPEKVDLVSSIKKVINNKKNQFIHNNLFPKLDSIMETVYVLSDQKWNEVMLDQIVSNAIKYSNAGDSHKNVTFTIEQNQAYTMLTITDEGIGIPKHDIRRVFEPFFTGENGRVGNSATGIGLFISSEISTKLGHEISIDSEVQKGTSVKIKYLTKL